MVWQIRVRNEGIRHLDEKESESTRAAMVGLWGERGAFPAAELSIWAVAVCNWSTANVTCVVSYKALLTQKAISNFKLRNTFRLAFESVCTASAYRPLSISTRASFPSNLASSEETNKGRPYAH
jgi:hypothetical protein